MCAKIVNSIHDISSFAMNYSFVHKFFSPVTAISRAVLDVLAPHTCVICDLSIHETSRSEFICEHCLDSLAPAPSSEEIYDDLLQHFAEDSLSVSKVYSRYAAGHDDDASFGILKAIHKLKYNGFSKLGIEFGRELGEMMKYLGETHYDAIIPVPIHHARRRERGYNQSELIATGMSQVMNVKCDFRSVHRIRYTSTQTKLSKAEREKNVANAFASHGSNELDNRIFLLVDDVLTTGSTVNTIATQMLEHGARRVDVVTIAKAVR